MNLEMNENERNAIDWLVEVFSKHEVAECWGELN